MTAPHGLSTQTFPDFYRAATGRSPSSEDTWLAVNGLPAQLQVLPGSLPSEVILAWLWRRLHGPDAVRALTPRRLIWALPRDSLLEPTASEIRRWLTVLDLTESVALHVVAGSRADDTGDWRENMYLPAIIVGTVDTLVSKALVRGFGISPEMAPIDFALVTNGAHWFINEPSLCPQTTTTLRQLADFTGRLGTAEPFGLTLASTSRPEAASGRLTVDPGDYQAIAASALDRHVPGTITIVALNTVAGAQSVYRWLRAGPVDVTLLHSRLRGIERGDRLAVLADASAGLADVPAGLADVPAEGRIVVTTRVVEGGLYDLDAALVIAEAAPERPLRTDLDDEAASRSHEGPAVIQLLEFIALFDTSTYLTDGPDIAPYVQDGDDLDVEVAWATWTPGPDGAPDPEVRHPPVEYRCRVGIAEAFALAADRAVWRIDHSSDAWVLVTAQPTSPLRPMELLLVNASSGGYDAELGFDPLSHRPVPDCPVLLTPDEQAAQAESLPPIIVLRPWQSLDDHSDQVRDQVAALLTAINPPGLSSDAARSAIIAGWLHDVGKAHPIWQDALVALAEDDERHDITEGRPWAKSGGRTGRLEFADDVSFRHELASLLLVEGPLRDLLERAPDQDLARFAIVAHHGKLRVQIADSAPRLPTPEGDPSATVPEAGSSASALDGNSPAPQILGLRHGARTAIPAMLGHPASTLTVNLDEFTTHGDDSWTNTMQSLLIRYGPFVLSYLETLVRISDWRASGGLPLPSR